MRIPMFFALTLALAAPFASAQSPTPPWEEFKVLYRESLERKFADARHADEHREPMICPLEKATYRIKIGGGRAGGRIRISGKIVSGDPVSLPLFDGAIALRDAQSTGGELIGGENGAIRFLPATGSPGFSIETGFMIEPSEDTRSKQIRLSIPPALQNSLEITLPGETQLIEAPGIADEAGVRHFSMLDAIEIRYLGRADLAAETPVDVDMLTVIEPVGRRAMMNVLFAPAAGPVPSFTLETRPETQYVASTLKPSWISRLDGGRYEISLPEGEAEPFSIQFAIDETTAGQFSLALPTIEGNNGREGDFAIDEPDDGQTSVTARTLVRNIPNARLGAGLRFMAGERASFLHAEPGSPIALRVKRFTPAPAPPVVLDAQYFFVSFEENGNALSKLILNAPPEAGPRLIVKPPPGAEVWSLKVNGKSRKVYEDADAGWIVPLDSGANSLIELTMLTRGERLGLHGRLETILPETGLAACRLCVTLALPERIELRSVEGAVSPSNDEWETPGDIAGRLYFFSRDFHKGESVSLAASYREPVNGNNE